MVQLIYSQVPEISIALVTYVVCIVFGFVGNALVLVAMIRADRKGRTATNVFLISLAVNMLSCWGGRIFGHFDGCFLFSFGAGGGLVARLGGCPNGADSQLCSSVRPGRNRVQAGGILEGAGGAGLGLEPLGSHNRTVRPKRRE